ncbi:VanZ family protein [Arthrobacter alpinus]|nr:VanZ family protein [Arthrobacter alpinus]
MSKPLHRITVALAAAYLLAVVLIVFWPTPVDRPAAGTLHQVLSWLYRHGMPRFVNYSVVEFSANIVMFIPLGIIASSYFKNAVVGVIIGALSSCLIELGQTLLLPDRYATGLDVLANTLGAGLGAFSYFLVTSRSGNPQHSSLTASRLPPNATIVSYATSNGAK